ncbi:MAG: PrsW family glutamic-type intramembrane protease [Aggregatilineales bacterium]
MGTYDPRLLITPPREEEEVYPYRRVWPSVLFEMAGAFSLGLIMLLAARFVTFPSALKQPAAVLVALFPAVLWLRFSWLKEKTVPEPRQGLLSVAVIAALAANAVGVPFVNNVLQPDEWLPLSGAISRIVGYAFTVSVVHEFIRYLVVRFTVWPSQYRTRLDAVAYGAAAGVGYATVLNLNFVLSADPTLEVTALRVFDELVRHVAGGIVVGYGLAEVRFNARPFPFLLAATIAFATLITGIAIPIVSGLTNVTLSVRFPVTVANPLRGFLFSALLMTAVAALLIFLYNTAIRQDQETAAGEV